MNEPALLERDFLIADERAPPDAALPFDAPTLPFESSANVVANNSVDASNNKSNDDDDDDIDDKNNNNISNNNNDDDDSYFDNRVAPRVVSEYEPIPDDASAPVAPAQSSDVVAQPTTDEFEDASSVFVATGIVADAVASTAADAAADAIASQRIAALEQRRRVVWRRQRLYAELVAECDCASLGDVAQRRAARLPADSV